MIFVQTQVCIRTLILSSILVVMPLAYSRKKFFRPFLLHHFCIRSSRPVKIQDLVFFLFMLFYHLFYSVDG